MIENWPPLSRVSKKEYDLGLASKDRLHASEIILGKTYNVRMVLDYSLLSFKAAEYVLKAVDKQEASKRRLCIPLLSPDYALITFSQVCLDTGKVLDITDERAVVPSGIVHSELPFVPLKLIGAAEGYVMGSSSDPGDMLLTEPIDSHLSYKH